MAKAAQLTTYRAKRDFARTSEPSGERPVAPSERLRFVIQKHAASRLHYDLRLEWDGVFKSWAVTRGPSLDPHDKRLAVEVEDHPLDYGDFEGTIPKGQYGGGTVQLWDRGYWKPEGSKTVAEALNRGELKISLNGKRLHGSWVLVRMRSDRSRSKRNNWLLIKHRDEHARPQDDAAALLAEDRSIASGRAMATIAAGKGRPPKPFMLAGSAAAADAVWQSNRGEAGPGISRAQPSARSRSHLQPSSDRSRSVRQPSSNRGSAHRVPSPARGESHRQPSSNRSGSLRQSSPNRSGSLRQPSPRGGSLRQPSPARGGSHRQPSASRSGSLPQPSSNRSSSLPQPSPHSSTAVILAQREARAGIQDSAQHSQESESDAHAPPRAAARSMHRQGASTRTRAHAALPEFIAPQLCQSVPRPPNEDGWVHEIKLDGYRIQLRVEGGKATLKTRKGLDWTVKFGAIARAASKLPDAILDGEIAALDHNGVPDFAALQAAFANGDSTRLVYFAFDLLYEGTTDLRKRPLVERKQALQALLADAAVEPALRYVEHFETPGDAVLESACKLELEGVISKKADAPYRSGRNGHWTKAKCRGGQEVVIGGYSTTDGRFRSLLVGLHRGKDFVYAGRVGTGFGQQKLQTLLPRLHALQVSRSPFTRQVPARGAANVHWVKPELVAEIEFAGWTSEGMVRQAAFKGLREDKPAAEVEVERAADPREVSLATPSAEATKHAPKRSRETRAGSTTRETLTTTRRKTSTETTTRKTSPARSSASSDKPIVMGVLLSNPEKLLWPAEDGEPAVSKIELARYFEQVGEWMLPHFAGRPCSIVRAPAGYQGQHFFQRHAKRGTSNLLSAVHIAGIDEPYLQVDRKEGLAALAQVGALELHPWNGQPGDPETPGRLVFDLDPGPDVAFGAVVEAAQEINSRLGELGLVGFCKTTGGKGLHVVTPLARTKKRLTWKEAKAFAHEVCLRMAADSPQRYLVNMAKRLRTKRIYLDYLRNDRMATAVGPLSPRARAHAPVSMPLTWAQVNADLAPARYTLHCVPALLAKSSAWREYCECERPLEEAVRRLGAFRASA